MESFDLIAIGAGWYGLGAARQYHAQHPHERVAIFDSASSIGGVWAKHRLYPGLKSNNLLGTFEYPDFPMDPMEFGVQPGQHILGKVIQAYQVAYAKNFGILDLIRLKSKVVSAENHTEGGWTLQIQCTTNEEEEKVAGDEPKATSAATATGKGTSRIFTRRLVLATGLVSRSFMPHIEGQDDYNRPLFHAIEFGKHSDTVDPQRTQRMTIVGGTKFAWDAAYAYATQGIKVDWIIRPSGHGPCWMAPPYVTPLKKWLEKLVNTRVIHWFSPCIWGQDSGYGWMKRFWHGTRVGRAITDAFWSILAQDVISLMGYDKHPEYKKLKPTSEAFYTGYSFSILNYDTDFLDLIKSGMIKVHASELSHLSDGKVHLDDANKTVLESDGMLCITGWNHVSAVKFLPEGIDRKIGLNHPLPNKHESVSPDEDLGCQSSLIAQADTQITSTFPRLKTPPKFNPNYVPLTKTKAFSAAPPNEATTPTSPKTTPMMLYRFMVPGTADFLRTKDIAFAGAVMNFSNVTCAHIQGLWISAYFDGKLHRDPSSAVVLPVEAGATQQIKVMMTLDQVHYETVLHNRFGKWRYPNDPGSSHPDFVFEAVPYLDMMMADLGLKAHRKDGWYREITEPYGPEDYRDINEEWESKYCLHSH